MCVCAQVGLCVRVCVTSAKLCLWDVCLCDFINKVTVIETLRSVGHWMQGAAVVAAGSQWV